MKVFKYICSYIAILIVALAASWLATCGIIKLITWCFGLNFSWPIATGIWLCLCLVSTIINKK